jgi:hypothetical protein
MWYYNEQPFEGPIDDWYGFVYLITEKSTNKKYVGKKFFWKKKTLPPLKGQKRKRRSIVESDWKEYYGSNQQLQENVAQNPDNYHREILHFCKKRADCSYYEIKEQIDRNVLFNDDYYNEFIGCKIHSKHLTNE